MALTAETTGESKYRMDSDPIRSQRLTVELNQLYVTGGYDLDLQDPANIDIAFVNINPYGGYFFEYNVRQKKLISYKGGIEIENGHDFYDAIELQYPVLLAWCYESAILKKRLLGQDVGNALAVVGLPDGRLLRKDINDSTGVGVATTIPSGASLIIEGEHIIESGASSEVKGELKIADGGTHVVESGGQQTIQAGAIQQVDSGGTVNLAPGATQSIAGNVIKVTAGTFPAGTTQSVDGGTLFGIDGAITPNIDTLTGGTEGKTIVIQCVSGIADPSLTATIHQSATIDLVADVDFVMKNLDVLSLTYKSGVWREPVGRVVKDGSSTVADGGTTTALPGSTTITSGAKITGNAIVFPAGISNPSIAGGNLFVVNGAITTNLVNFMGGQNGVEITITCSLGPVTISHNPSYIVLKGKTNLVMQQFDSISFRMEDGAWVEQTSSIKNGWVPINDTGMIKVFTGGGTDNGGVEIKTPITAPAPISAGTLDASKNSYFNIDGSVTPAVSSISGGVLDQIVQLGITVGSCTVSNGGNIQLSKDLDWTMKVEDVLQLTLKSNGKWTENYRYDRDSLPAGTYTLFTWSGGATLSPVSSGVYLTIVDSDGTFNMGNLPAGLSVIVVFRNNHNASWSVTMGTNIVTEYAPIIGIIGKEATISMYCNGVSWKETSHTLS